MNKYRIGRFAFFLPYLLMPLLVSLFYADDFKNALIFAYFLPIGAESPIILIYPVCWGFAIYCFVKNRKIEKAERLKAEQQGITLKKKIPLFQIFVILWLTVHALLIGYMVISLLSWQF